MTKSDSATAAHPLDSAAAFTAQVQSMLTRGYPGLAGITTEQFLAAVMPLQAHLGDLPRPSHERSIPFVIVVTRALVTPEQVMGTVVDQRGRHGVVNMEPVGPADFAPRDGTEVPAPSAYLLADIDTGGETLNVRPKDALPLIVAQSRLPLTIDEGVSIMGAYPDVLHTHNAFQLLASRRADQRIPSIWTSYGQPRLGWCWDGAPHAWMGSASAAARLA